MEANGRELEGASKPEGNKKTWRPTRPPQRTYPAGLASYFTCNLVSIISWVPWLTRSDSGHF